MSESREISVASPFRNLADTMSGPDALRGFIFPEVFLTPFNCYFRYVYFEDCRCLRRR